MVILVFTIAFAIPIVLLYLIHARPWYLHGLAVAAALALGMLEVPENWKSPTLDLAMGGTIVLLLVWGLGGIFPAHRRHTEKHA